MTKIERAISESIVNLCHKRRNQILAGRINFKEYAYRLMLDMVSVIEADLPRCIESIPVELTASFTEYLRVELEPVDFMPDPRIFLVGPYSELQIENKKQELRPNYLRLYHSMTLRNAEINGS